jgi:hypothetical protein
MLDSVSASSGRLCLSASGYPYNYVGCLANAFSRHGFAGNILTETSLPILNASLDKIR